MIVLKHLSREFDVSPARLRRLLRTKFKHKGRWQWKEDTPALDRVRAFLRQAIERSGDIKN